jgi:hypothetical protein
MWAGQRLDNRLRTDHRGLAGENALHQERVHLDIAISTAVLHHH